ncbi:sodium/hydrogen exchanger NHE2 [Besnoitia besnoiti]|uniref:Sodium/hydrogen exchanger NHE2 n=1 Tax=Besnoitia besnoiti TaxID=94643 RepID=A0A2A9M5U3_BESBE|nr:sodium/hydrogen exchanger NHE2 [Besnoitia besnoiti]PFH32564.1 sodium/hydrogen exchanger NHE2 [Besnoitia besnoiti]
MLCCPEALSPLVGFRVTLEHLSDSSSNQGDLAPTATMDPGVPSTAEAQHEHAIVMIIASISFIYLLSACLAGIVGLLPKFRPPITVVLFLAGMSLQPLLQWMQNGVLLHGVQLIGNVDPYLIFFALLPMCLYESSAFVNYHMFKQVLPSSLLLAIPGVAVNIILFAAFLRYGISRIYDWPAALMTASIVSATDPVAVIACLRALGAPEKLSSLIDGESLLNDGSAVVFFEVFRSLVIGTYTGVGSSITLFVQLSFGALAYGLAIGVVLYLWLLTVREFHIVQVTGTIAAVFTVFFTADHFLHVSGVLAVVTLGVFMAAKGSTALQRSIQKVHHESVELLSTLSVQAIFVCGGVIASRLLIQYADTWTEWAELFLIYLVLQAARFVVVYGSWPFIQWMGLPLSWKECFIISYGGLRGVVCLALGLVVEADPRVPPQLREHVGICVAGTVLFTLLINGTTAELLYTRMRLYPISKYRREYLDYVLSSIDASCDRKKNELKNYWLFRGTDVVQAANEALPLFSKGHLDSNGNLHVPGKSYSEILRNPPSCDNWSVQSAASSVAKLESKDFGVPARLGWGEGLGSALHTVKHLTGNRKPATGSGGGIGGEDARTNEDVTLIVKEAGRLEKETHVLHVMFSAMREFYTDMYERSNIGGTACLTLTMVVDKCHSYLDAQLKEATAVKKSRKNDYSKSVFSHEWDLLLGSLRSRYGLWKCLSAMPCDAFDILKSYLIAMIQTLYAVVEAHEFVNQTNRKELEELVSAETLEPLDEVVTSAKELLEKLKNTFPVAFSQCLVIIASHMLLNAKQKVLNEEIERGLVFPEDAEKLKEAIAEQRMRLERISR